jgi:hypothetical protein
MPPLLENEKSQIIIRDHPRLFNVSIRIRGSLFSALTKQLCKSSMPSDDEMEDRKRSESPEDEEDRKSKRSESSRKRSESKDSSKGSKSKSRSKSRSKSKDGKDRSGSEASKDDNKGGRARSADRGERLSVPAACQPAVSAGLPSYTPPRKKAPYKYPCPPSRWFQKTLRVF